MKPARFDELFNKVYEGGSLDSTEGVELVDELDSAYKRIGEQMGLVKLQEIEIEQLRRELARKVARSA